VDFSEWGAVKREIFASIVREPVDEIADHLEAIEWCGGVAMGNQHAVAVGLGGSAWLVGKEPAGARPFERVLDQRFNIRVTEHSWRRTMEWRYGEYCSCRFEHSADSTWHCRCMSRRVDHYPLRKAHSG
jgi:hypothetical protein